MNDKPSLVFLRRLWQSPWFWTVAAATVLVCFAAPTVAHEDSGSDKLKDCIQLAIGFMAIAILPHLAWYEVNFVYRHPPRWRPNWFWLVLAGVLVGVARNAYVIWNSIARGEVGSPMSVVISLLAWSVSFLFLSFILRLLGRIFRWLWVARRRYWIWLGVWSLAVATVTIIFTARSRAFTGYPDDEDTILIRQEIGFIGMFIVVLVASYLFIFTCRNLPRRWKTWFWLGMAGVASGILWTSLLVWAGAAHGEVFDWMDIMVLWLMGSVFFLFLTAFLHALRNFFRWLFSWRIMKRCLVALAGLIILIAAFYAEENWRGRHAWENYKHEQEARGEKFDLLSFAPPVVPDDQNFAMAPIVTTSYEWCLDKSGHRIIPMKTNIVDRMALDLWRANNYFPNNMKSGSWQEARLTELKPWQDYYRATAYTNRWPVGGGKEHIDIIQLDTNQFPVAPQPQSPAADVLLALSRYDAALTELRQAGARPYSRFPLNYQEGNPVVLMLPHLSSLKYSAVFLQLRAIAEVQAGQTEQTLADVKLMLRLAESIHDEPTLISQLVGISVANLALQPVWEGLAERRWSDAQMKELGGQLEKLDLISGLQIGMHGERVSRLGYIDCMKTNRDQYSLMLLYAICPRFFSSMEKDLRYLPGMPDVPDWFARRRQPWQREGFMVIALGRMLPVGWYDWNKVALAKMYQDHLFQICQPEKHLVSLKATTEANQFIDSAGQPSNINPQDALALMFAASSTYLVQKIANAQNAVDMAIVACALERYHLAQGEYPETLGALAPEYIETVPPDVVDGQPLHFRRTQEGRYLLYSVGWNGKDDGGVLGRDEFGHFASHLGDWVWQYPAK